MPDHRAVEAVLGHDAGLAPALLSLPPLGSTVLKPDLKWRILLLPEIF